MRIDRLLVLAGTSLVAALLAWPLPAQFDPIFDFIPLGGRSHLAQVLESKPPAAEVQALLTAKRTREEWVEYLKGRAKTISVLQKFDDR